MKCLTSNLEVNYPCSSVCPLYGDCVAAFYAEAKRRVKTNADRIRAMSDEELAMFQAERSAADSFLRIKDEGHEVTAAQRAALINRLYGTWMAYLKQPAEEADDESQT